VLNKVLHHPIRTQIIALLYVKDAIAFKVLKKELELSDGAIATHIKALDKEGYIKIHKFFEENKPKTEYSITPKGKDDFYQYITQLKGFINDVEPPQN
jgi:predicted transcriptional regulator